MKKRIFESGAQTARTRSTQAMSDPKSVRAMTRKLKDEESQAKRQLDGNGADEKEQQRSRLKSLRSQAKGMAERNDGQELNTPSDI